MVRLEAVQVKGPEKVNSEALMIASGQNVKRLVAFGPRRPKKIAMVAALRPPEKPSPAPDPPTSHNPSVAFFNRLSTSMHSGE
jgi:hypothetical protein